ncbi:MAG: hypothetical protein AB7P69_01190 [Candidatus Binatia bacterium]
MRKLREDELTAIKYIGIAFLVFWLLIIVVHYFKEYEPQNLTAAVGTIAGIAFAVGYHYGKKKGDTEGFKAGEELTRIEVISKASATLQEEYQEMILRLRGDQKSILLDKRLFVEMRDFLRRAYKIGRVFDEKTFNLLRSKLFPGSDWIGGEPMEPVQALIHEWDNICRGSMEILDSVESVHFCEHRVLHLKQSGKYLKSISAMLDRCEKFQYSFPLE